MKIKETINYLKTKKKILFITTSNRWMGEKGGETPKSTQLAIHIAKTLPGKPIIIDIPKLKIYPCEGNVSAKKGNTCGLKESQLKNKTKNPSGLHRCWASINHSDDELWKISKELFKSDCIVFFTSIRWGQTNEHYQKLIERLTWIENMQSTLKEKNPIKNIEAGIIAIGHNWNGKNVIKTQKKVLEFYGFKVIKELCWNWQYTNNENDESNLSYQKDTKKFEKLLVNY